jgi:uncharacterized protein YecE (DUF72 family)
MALYVGTSGWAYPEWKPSFYPEGLARSRFLEHYARELSACEINATFYRVQPERAVARWAEATPPHFRFAVKAHRALTHSASVAPRGFVADLLEGFLGSLEPLSHRLAVVLLQFPAHRTSAEDDVIDLLRVLGQRVAFAAEFRHESWHVPEVYREVMSAGGTVCASEADGEAPVPLPPGRIGYARLRSDRYGTEERDRWRVRLRAEAAARDVYVFTKHRNIAPEDQHGGVGLARWLDRTRGSTDS